MMNVNRGFSKIIRRQRLFSTSTKRSDSLLFIEHRDGHINQATLSALTAASKVNGKVVGLVAGSENIESIVDQAKKLV